MAATAADALGCGSSLTVELVIAGGGGGRAAIRSVAAEPFAPGLLPGRLPATAVPVPALGKGPSTWVALYLEQSVKLLKKQTEEKKTTLKAYQEKEATLVATIQNAITEIAKLQSLMADEPGAEVLTLDPDDSDELMLPQTPQEADFLKTLETALQVSRETTRQFSGKWKVGPDVELEWPSEERAKAAALAVRQVYARSE